MEIVNFDEVWDTQSEARHFPYHVTFRDKRGNYWGVQLHIGWHNWVDITERQLLKALEVIRLAKRGKLRIKEEAN